jgi:MFS family permease
MRAIIHMLRAERQARTFFLVLAQSALGTGAGYVALLLVAYDRYESAWAISLVLLADLLPAMLLGPVFGAVADRWSRRVCLIVADVVRAAGFLGVILVPSFEATLAFALLAGVGTALFTPAALSTVPSLVASHHRAPATSLYGAVADLGFTAGPGLAAILLVVGSAESILIVNVVTFAVSAAVLLRMNFGARPAYTGAGEDVPMSLMAGTRQGLTLVTREGPLRALLLASAAVLLCGGVFNVGELPLVTQVLEAPEVWFSVLVALYGLGFIAGSLAGSSGGDRESLKRRYLAGLGIMSAGFVGAALAPTLLVASLTFAVAGLGNGMVLVFERLLIQEAVPDELLGRVFGVKDALTAWAFGLAFLGAGALISAFGVRPVLVVAGAAGLAIWMTAHYALRKPFSAGAAVYELAPVPEVAHGARRAG